jgi:hypothetical protein
MLLKRMFSLHPMKFRSAPEEQQRAMDMLKLFFFYQTKANIRSKDDLNINKESFCFHIAFLKILVSSSASTSFSDLLFSFSFSSPIYPFFLLLLQVPLLVLFLFLHQRNLSFIVLNVPPSVLFLLPVGGRHAVA